MVSVVDSFNASEIGVDGSRKALVVHECLLKILAIVGIQVRDFFDGVLQGGDDMRYLGRIGSKFGPSQNRDWRRS
jgi:hypothetical protein